LFAGVKRENWILSERRKEYGDLSKKQLLARSKIIGQAVKLADLGFMV
jgi:hypothetical protein